MNAAYDATDISLIMAEGDNRFPGSIIASYDDVDNLPTGVSITRAREALTHSLLLSEPYTDIAPITLTGDFTIWHG